MPDVEIDDNCLLEVERRLNVYFNSNKLEQLENQHAEKLRERLEFKASFLGRGSLVVKITDSWPLSHEFELRTAPPYRNAMHVKSVEAQTSLLSVGVMWKLGGEGGNSGDVLVT
ncbi:hypothetical protein TNCV_4384501 [Trichonephila clavipes]|nr:hypothetical protein TNCV_4384501 [Trichonephila clavipes]